MVLKFATFFKKKLRINYLHVLCLLWLLLIYFTERIYPVQTLQQCNWDRWEPWAHQAAAATTTTKNGGSPLPIGVPTRVGLFGDPQIIDNFSYPGRNYFLKRASIFITDLYHRKNWVFANRVLHFDRKFFLGDLFDGGREWKSPEQDAAWEQEYDRFMHIFSDSPEVRNSEARTVFSLPGNHDIGFGNTLVQEAHARFVKHFGETSSYHFVGNHTILLLDTIAIMNTDSDQVYRKPYEFLNNYIMNVNDEMKQQPTVLLSHVPLFRDPSLSCGSKRESKENLPYVKGYQYQTMVSPEITDTILKTIQPVAVFSGDDHDACYIQHNYTVADPAIMQTAEEYTTKSISMAMGITRPGIQLLSLYHPRGVPAVEAGGPRSFETKICYLPNPFYPFILFFLLGLFTVVFLLSLNFLPVLIPIPMYKALGSHPVVGGFTDDDDTAKRGFSSAAADESDEFRNRAGVNKRTGAADIELVSSLRYEDEETNSSNDHSGNSMSSLGGGISKGGALANASRLIASAAVWKHIIWDLAIIFSVATTFFTILSITIYWE
ncbi:hypothetical protein D0Z00_002013 [Geotrichum galactomycetum]|uniref:Uncharacterized protein n=1 Tax=Geotrichum galactomycetum TaxID=27317 RepID=A0ACB6V5A2_9ASCO|nr:hypothetical protein D0Z00_002013 [Geotrichum candidum]